MSFPQAPPCILAEMGCCCYNLSPRWQKCKHQRLGLLWLWHLNYRIPFRQHSGTKQKHFWFGTFPWFCRFLSLFPGYDYDEPKRECCFPSYMVLTTGFTLVCGFVPHFGLWFWQVVCMLRVCCFFKCLTTWKQCEESGAEMFKIIKLKMDCLGAAFLGRKGKYYCYSV